MSLQQSSQSLPRPSWGSRFSGAFSRLARFRVLFRWIIVVLLIGMAIGIAAGVSWVRSLDINKLSVPVLAPTQLMDLHGQASSELSSVKVERVTIDQIPLHMRQAIVAVEDKRFYDHSGVDAFGIVRAAVRNVREGSTAQGGSTITQQLAKNVFLTEDKTFSRKLTEAGYAFKIESSYDKDQILEMYLNQIYFGEGQWGIQKASRRYFGKDTKDLTLAESALLAALPKAPTRYSPLRNKELALERRNLVLGVMRDENFISEIDYNQAKMEPIQVLVEKPQDDNSLLGKFASYNDAVVDEAIKLYGFTERQLLAGNLRIYTQLDPVVQQAMETAYQNESLFPPSAQDQLIQSGAVLIDPRTGGIRGVVGQRGEHVFRGFSYATHLERQPGSTFKPIMVYAPALEKGYTPETMLYDGPLDINGYKPQNWDHRNRGQVSLRDAIIKSWNIPPVWLLNEIGLNTGKTFVKKLGIPLEKEDHNLGMALGGLSKGVSPLQMAQAYSVFPNRGTVIPAHTIVKITTADGKVLAEAKHQPQKVMSEENAYKMTEMLTAVVAEGTGTRAAMDRPLAGKTGTTQLPDDPQFKGMDGSKDAWFVGYTPELVGAVWLGYDQTDSQHYLSTSGGQAPAYIFKEMMSLALKDVPASAFTVPESIMLAQQAALLAAQQEERKKQEENKKKEENRKKEDKKRFEELNEERKRLEERMKEEARKRIEELKKQEERRQKDDRKRNDDDD
ncbi:MAG: family penicillin-binding protein [Paenibacillus sp.]|nr:family penicillin-binding protein [Paenibacillus sp.]